MSTSLERSFHETPGRGSLLGRRKRYAGAQTAPISRGTDGANKQVDVERPAPANRRHAESSSNNRPKHNANTPCQTGSSNIQRTLRKGSSHGNESHDAHIQSCACHSAQGAADNHHVHARCCTADGRAYLEDHDVQDVRPFCIELAVQLPPNQVCSGGAEQEGHTEPGQLVELAQVLDNDGLDIGNDGVIQGVEED